MQNTAILAQVFFFFTGTTLIITPKTTKKIREKKKKHEKCLSRRWTSRNKGLTPQRYETNELSPTNAEQSV